MFDTHQVPALPEFQKYSVPGGSDGVAVSCYHTLLDKNKPSIVIALPFGIPVEVARAAFNRFQPKYNVVTWENRYVLNLDVAFSGAENFTTAAQVGDMVSVLRALKINQCRLIGYCSGGGIALLAAKQHPDLFTELILVSGEYQLFRRGHVATASIPFCPLSQPAVKRPT
jgi:pimeloyl-ACP methyl ester carboxylesterase